MAKHDRPTAHTPPPPAADPTPETPAAAAPVEQETPPAAEESDIPVYRVRIAPSQAFYVGAANAAEAVGKYKRHCGILATTNPVQCDQVQDTATLDECRVLL